MQINAKDYPTLSAALLEALAKQLDTPKEEIDRAYVIPLLTNFCKMMVKGYGLAAGLLGLPLRPLDLPKELGRVENELLDPKNPTHGLSGELARLSVESYVVNTIQSGMQRQGSTAQNGGGPN